MNEFLRTILFLPEQQSTVARDVDWLHYFVILTTMGGATLVTVVTAYFLYKYRRSAGRAEQRPADPDPMHTGRGMSLVTEGVVVVGLLSLFLLWWVLGFRQYIHIRTPPQDAMEIYVTAKKWMWGFTYPNGRGSKGVLYVPVHRPVKLIMTSRDVIHSFFVPQFRIKQDVVPGRVTTAWFEVKKPGTYDLYCTEYCGLGHSAMLAQVVALDPADYLARITGQKGVTLADIGERAANRHGCLRCHTVDGTPHIGPTWARMYGSTVNLESGATVVADEAYITESMMDPLAKLHRGFPPIMPSYQGLISAADTAAIVEYIKSLRTEPIMQEQSPLPQGTAPTVTISIPAQPEQDAEQVMPRPNSQPMDSQPVDSQPIDSQQQDSRPKEAGQ